MFERASQLKLRFKTHRGYVTVEDLWDIPLLEINKDNVCLDELAKALNREIRAGEEESFVLAETEANTLLVLQFDIVKHVIAYKREILKTREQELIRKQQKDQILEAIAVKEKEASMGHSLEELKEMLGKL